MQRLIPPWDSIKFRQWVGGVKTQHLSVDEQFGDISKDTEVHLTIKSVLPIKMVAKHTEHSEPNGFTDEQMKGPFRHWKHQHRFNNRNDNSSELTDTIDFSSPGFGLLDSLFVPTINRTFAYRHKRTLMDLLRHNRFNDVPRKKVVLSGASGLIGEISSAFPEIRWSSGVSFGATQTLKDRPKSFGMPSRQIDGHNWMGLMLLFIFLESHWILVGPVQSKQKNPR